MTTQAETRVNTGKTPQTERSGALNPVGMPLATDVLSGEGAERIRNFGSFQIPVDSFSAPLVVIGWQAQP
jgi:hypothetical protein